MGGESPYLEEIRKANKSLLSGISEARGAITSTAQNMNTNLTLGYNEANKALDQYFNQAIQDGNKWAQTGYEAYQKMNQGVNDPQAGLSNFLNSADYKLYFGGQNGQGGDPNASALDRFQASPDYQFRLNQQNDAIRRQASAQGYQNDPRLQQELMSQSGQLASQEYNNYFQRLNSVYNNYNTNLQGTAALGFNAMQGNQKLQADLGTNKANLASGYGQGLASTSQWYGEGMANSYLARGNADASYRLVRAAAFAPNQAPTVQGWLGKIG